MKKWLKDQYQDDWFLATIMLIVVALLLLALGALSCGLLSNFIHWVQCDFTCPFFPLSRREGW